MHLWERQKQAGVGGGIAYGNLSRTPCRNIHDSIASIFRSKHHGIKTRNAEVLFGKEREGCSYEHATCTDNSTHVACGH